MTALRDVITRSIIVCYKEDIGELELALATNGLAPSALRGTYTPEEQTYPAAIRTFINHRNAWRIASEQPGYTLICEADFVPCRDLGSFPVFWPLGNPLAWGYLYQGSPRLLSIVGPERYLRGHCAPTVCYVVNQPLARLLLDFYEIEIDQYGPHNYFSFEAHIQWWLMKYKAEAYIPARHYGEHGGLPNPEHSKFAIVRRNGAHRADNLEGPLAFRPTYAQGSRINFWRERIVGRAFAWLRLFGGRWIIDTDVYLLTTRDKIPMYWIGVCRLLPRWISGSLAPRQKQ